ncbi:hypothetical protein FHG87_015298, partial [Trinorchestia longiramus]
PSNEQIMDHNNCDTGPNMAVVSNESSSNGVDEAVDLFVDATSVIPAQALLRSVDVWTQNALKTSLERVADALASTVPGGEDDELDDMSPSVEDFDLSLDDKFLDSFEDDSTDSACYEAIFMNELEEDLDKFTTINDDDYLAVFVGLVEKFSSYLPGPLTLEKYAGVDVLNSKQLIFKRVGYLAVLNKCVHFLKSVNCQHSGCRLPRPNPKPESESCSIRVARSKVEYFILNGYFEEYFPLLLHEIGGSHTEASNILSAISALVQNWTIMDALLRFSKMEATPQPHSHFPVAEKLNTTEPISTQDNLDVYPSSVGCLPTNAVWSDLITRIASLPDKVANAFPKDAPEELRAKKFFSHVGYCCLLATCDVCVGLKHGVSCNMTPIASLILKICSRSHVEDVLEPLVSWLPRYCALDPALSRVSQALTTKLLQNGFTKDRILRYIFSHPAMTTSKLFMLLGTGFLNDTLLANFLSKALLVSDSGADDEAALLMVRFLAKVPDDHACLKSTLMHLLDMFANSCFVCYVPFPSQVNVCRSLVLCFSQLTERDVAEIKPVALPKLLRGVASGLDGTDVVLRSVVMLLGEQVSKILSRDGPHLEFEYVECDVVKRLRVLLEKMNSEGFEHVGATDVRDNKDTVSALDCLNKELLEEIGNLRVGGCVKGSAKQVNKKQTVTENDDDGTSSETDASEEDLDSDDD